MKFEKLRTKAADFFRSEFYLSLLAVLIVLFWATGQEILGTIIIVLLACVYLFLGKDLSPVVSTIMLITMVYSLKQINSRPFIIVVAVLVPILIASFVYNFVRFRKERTFRKGKLYYPMAIALVAAMCGGICFAPYNKMWTFAVLGVGVGLYLLYFLFLNCVEGDKRDLICRILVTAALIVCVEVMIWFIRQPNILESLKEDDLRLGWSMKNTFPLILAMAAPAAVYLGLTRRDYSFVMFPLLLLFASIIFLSRSRGNLLFGMPVLIVCFLYAFIRSNNKVRAIACASVALWIGLVFAAMPIFRAITFKLFHDHKGGFFDDNGRAPIYKQTLEHFFANPVFGVGYFKYKGGVFVKDGPALTFLWKAHNTIFQILCCNGLVGVVGLMPFFTARYRLLIKDFSMFKFFALLSLIVYECEGMVDVAFLSVHELFFLLGMFAAAESEGNKERLVGTGKFSKKVALMQKVPLHS